ncbi:MAG: RsmB/NOP family class I SAM-dependent RNA methyltransferase [Clostridia bacterium]|nr:RsmB/NOP family class I SAM-dependent RNA methyltransferase [Clostridia bacterium]
MKLPQNFVRRMADRQDMDIEEFLKSYDTPSESGIRINPLKKGGEALLKNAFGELDRVPWCKNGFYAHKELVKGTHPYHLAGLFYFQEPSAMCAAELLPLEEGDRVLDLCAAPGGKSTQLAANPGITLVSNEIIPKRSLILSENIERMGFSNVIVTNESPERLENKYSGVFDKIIIDAPCSGEGMFKKEPAALEAWSVEHVKSCADRQKKIIDSAMKMLRTGGAIVYSTCTFAIEENEQNVEYITQKYPYMKVGKVTKIYPHLQRGEGHFAAYLYDSREKTGFDVLSPDKPGKTGDAVELFRSFEKEWLNISLDGDFVLFGENLYLKPGNIPIDGIKTVRPGLHLGVCKKGRFEPAYALAKALDADAFKLTVDYSLSSPDTLKYLKGETLSVDLSGFAAILCDGLPLGWVKGSGGILKNRLPKGLRIF